MIELRVARGSRPTGRVLAVMLGERGVSYRLPMQMDSQGPANAVVCYGYGYSGSAPALNKAAGRYDKLEQLQQLHTAGVRVPQYVGIGVVPGGTVSSGPFLPWLARQRTHQGGTDIMPVLQDSDFQHRVAAGAQFFTQYIPSQAEYRVWSYRRRHLGTYQKVLAYPQKYKGIGRNYDNGFAFQLVRSADLPGDAVALGAAAVQALGLDFGATDILHGSDGRFYVLEVNTAPGVEGPDRQVIQGLADKIAKWVELGYPRRNGEAA